MVNKITFSMICIFVAVSLALGAKQVKAVKWISSNIMARGVGHVCQDGVELFAGLTNTERKEDAYPVFFDLNLYNPETGLPGALIDTVKISPRQQPIPLIDGDGFKATFYGFERFIWPVPLAAGTAIFITDDEEPTVEIVETCLLAPPSTITMIKDSLPDRRRNFHYEGDLGPFNLDDPNFLDGDRAGNMRRFTVPLDDYTITEQVPTGWYLTDIFCDAPEQVEVEVADHLVTVNLTTRADVTCTFVNERRSVIRALKYLDRNRNGRHNGGEPWLSGWTIKLYSEEGDEVGSMETNQFGKVSFPSVQSGLYTLCEQLQSGWFNTQPATMDPTFELPCYHIEIGPGQAVSALFGNATESLVTSAAQSGSNAGLLIELMADTNEPEGGKDAVPTDDEWLTSAEPELTSAIYLPLIRQ